MEDLLKIALVGTGKHPGRTGAEHPTDKLLQNMETDTEQMLLLRAGLQRIYGQAGRKPDRIAPLDPAPQEELASFSPRLVGLLRNALATDSTDLLQEISEALTAYHLKLPHELLPQALNIKDISMRERLLPLLGERGRWLSRFRPEWSWATEEFTSLTESGKRELRRLWDEGNVSERCRALARLRQSDPQEGLTWIAETFKQEKPQNRTKLLEQLKQGLNSDDESFLNEAIADRSEPVRRLAASLLSQLPGSALSRRMCERAGPLLQMVQTPSRPKLECHPPEQVDGGWVQDGIPKSPPSGRGQRAYWTETLLAYVAPAYWCERFQATPAELIRAVADDQFAEPVITGWTLAAGRIGNRDGDAEAWAKALWTHWTDRAVRLQGAAAENCFERLSELVPLLDQPVAERSVLGLLRGGSPAGELMGLRLLALLPRPWSAEFSQRYLQLVRQVLKTRSDNAAYQWAESLGLAARSIPGECFAVAAEPREFAPQERTPWRASALLREADRFLEQVRARESFFGELDGLRAASENVSTVSGRWSSRFSVYGGQPKG